MLKVTNAARLPGSITVDASSIHAEIIRRCSADREKFLDVIDAALVHVNSYVASELENQLALGGSAWRVASDGHSLARRVDPTAQAVADKAMTPNDAASEELKEAWGSAYGRSPNASDAWDHAIKAVEAVLIPAVVPKQDSAQIGHAIGQLDRQGNLYRFVLPGKDESNSVAPFVVMLRSIWPNPDRHAASSRRTPALQEAQAVVHLAVTLVQLLRDGAIAEK